MYEQILAETISNAQAKNPLNYELLRGNPLWRFALMLLVILIALLLARIIQVAVTSYADRLERKKGISVLSLFLKCISKPLYVEMFALGLMASKVCLFFNDETGIRLAISDVWIKVAQTVQAIAIVYAIYRLVDVIEHYLTIWTSKTQTKLDDMLVPVVRKALRVTITIIAVLFIAESILGADQIRTVLLSAGVGGIAIALAAKDTIANFFGSVTIFADRPFQIDDRVKIDGYDGPVEEVGLRSTRIRTLQGHLVTIPNNTVANTAIENISKRPHIRRTSNITITYGSGHKKAAKAVEIIKNILADTPEVNQDQEKLPRVYFNDFNDWSLNIYMTYWVKPPDWWLFQEVNERVNLEMIKQFETAGIDFAFPTQTLYMKKED